MCQGCISYCRSRSYLVFMRKHKSYTFLLYFLAVLACCDCLLAGALACFPAVIDCSLACLLCFLFLQISMYIHMHLPNVTPQGMCVFCCNEHKQRSFEQSNSKSFNPELHCGRNPMPRIKLHRIRIWQVLCC